MRRDLLFAMVLPFLAGACAPEPEQAPTVGVVDHGPGEHRIYPSGEIAWQEGPESLEPGAEIAELEGDPAQPEVFTMRIRMPDGYSIAPHWHPNVERVTVISGTFRLGMGDQLDVEATQALGPGSYVALPPETQHFAIAQGETVVQLTSVGPWRIHYVNPDDDPRLR